MAAAITSSADQHEEADADVEEVVEDEAEAAELGRRA